MRCSCSTCTRPARCGLRGGSHKLARAAVRRANGASPHATPGARMYGVGLSSSTIATRALKRVVGLPTRSAIACSPARLGTPRPACPQGVAMHICSSSARRTRSGPLIERQPCRGARAVSPHWPLDSRAVRRSAQMNRRRHLSQFASGTRCVVSRETAACRCNAWHTDGPARGCADSTISVASVWLATTISVGVSHSAASHSSASTPGGTLSSALEPAVRGGNGRRHTDPAGTSGFADQAAKVL